MVLAQISHSNIRTRNAASKKTISQRLNIAFDSYLNTADTAGDTVK